MTENINSSHTSDQSCEFVALIGLDWATEHHDFCLLDPTNNKTEFGRFDHSPEKIGEWVIGLVERFGQGKIAICLEQSRGPLIYALLGYENLVLFPVNPKTISKLRSALYPNEPKDDRLDAKLALKMLILHREVLRPLQPLDAESNKLNLLSERRRELVDLQADQSNRLQSFLKHSYPQAIEMIGTNPTSRMATAFLQRWPTLESLQQAKPQQLRKFYYKQNCRKEECIQKRLKLAKNALPLTEDAAIIETYKLMVLGVVNIIIALNDTIDQIEEVLSELVESHQDSHIFQSLKGAGPAFVPRMIGAFGTDRDRFPQASDIQCFSGIAPVTRQTGKAPAIVVKRWQCPRFLRQTFHEFAKCSVNFNGWAKCYYDDQRAKGKKKHVAYRALAYKWLRIIWKCWHDKVPYDEAKYIRALQKKGLKIYSHLQVEQQVTKCE